MNAWRGGQKLYGNKLFDAALASTEETVKMPVLCCRQPIPSLRV
jgi:hypothetical protein